MVQRQLLVSKRAISIQSSEWNDQLNVRFGVLVEVEPAHGCYDRSRSSSRTRAGDQSFMSSIFVNRLSSRTLVDLCFGRNVSWLRYRLGHVLSLTDQRHVV